MEFGVSRMFEMSFNLCFIVAILLRFTCLDNVDLTFRILKFRTFEDLRIDDRIKNIEIEFDR